MDPKEFAADVRMAVPGWRTSSHEHLVSFAQYAVTWSVPETFTPFIATMAKNKRLTEAIAYRIQFILNSRVFRQTELILDFADGGFGLSLGGRCTVWFRDGRMSQHNIDTPDQCFFISMVLITIADEVFKDFLRRNGVPPNDENAPDHFCLTAQPIMRFPNGEVTEGDHQKAIWQQRLNEYDPLQDEGIP